MYEMKTHVPRRVVDCLSWGVARLEGSTSSFSKDRLNVATAASQQGRTLTTGYDTPRAARPFAAIGSHC